MCRRGESIDVVHVPVLVVNELTAVMRVKYMPIDKCIAPIVRALNAAGIPTTTACCGHGEHLGAIGLAGNSPDGSGGHVLLLASPSSGESVGSLAIRAGRALREASDA